MKHFLVLTSFCMLVGCVPKERETRVSSDFVEIEDAYHFYVFGDWGRNGDYRQDELADMMNIAAHAVEPEIIVSTGDNFYPNGVASVDDPYWISSYENIYDGAALFCPWYVILGNHDYRGNYQAQIDYTNVSQRWNMPDQYFLKDVVTDDGATIRFVFIDTTPLNDEYYEEEKYRKAHGQIQPSSYFGWIQS